MIIYHTTFHVDRDVWTEGLNYLKQRYIPDATRSGLLSRPVLQQVLQDGLQDDEADGGSLCVQFRVKDQETLRAWMLSDGIEIQRELTTRFGAGIAGFSTLLDEISLD